MTDTIQIEEDSNLVQHARLELERIGEEPETVRGYLEMISIFSRMGHSGGSASVFIPTLNELLQFNNLSPLTNDPEEWMDVTDGMWQNRRCSKAFSNDGGKTYTLLGEEGRPVHTSQEAGG